MERKHSIAELEKIWDSDESEFFMKNLKNPEKVKKILGEKQMNNVVCPKCGEITMIDGGDYIGNRVCTCYRKTEVR